jgi:hypothetical protein
MAIFINSFLFSESDPYFSDVVLLLHCDGTDGSTTFNDSSSSAHTITAVGNAQLDTNEKKFGSASALFDGTGDYLDVPNNADFAFGTGDFTLECWIYIISGNAGVFDFRPTNTQGAYPTIFIDGLSIYYFVNGVKISGTAPSTGSWSHIALTRSGTSTKIFVNGTQTGSTYTDTTNYQQSRVRLAELGFLGFGYDLNGWMDEVRITKGIARYTANFTPPTAPFPSN